MRVKINILWLIDRAGSLPVEKSNDLRLIREFPLILGIWLKFLLRRMRLISDYIRHVLPR